MKKYLALILALFFLPYTVHATVLLTESFENGWNGWTHDYGGSSIVTDSSAPSGTHTLMFTYPAASWISGNGPDIDKKSFTPSSEIYFQYWFKYEAGFDDGEVTNKLVYIDLESAPGGTNVAIMGHNQWSGNGIWWVVQQPSAPDQNTWGYSSGYSLSYGVWHKMTVHMKMNTSPGVSDGVMQIWMDDVLIINNSKQLYALSNQSGQKFTAFEFSPVYGMGTPSHMQYLWFDDLTIQTTPFGIGGTPPPLPSPKTPGFPENLKIN
jgi:hypothetical protein